MDIVRVENLTKIYGEGDNRVVALNNISFKVEKGEFLSIVGASGSGKSTLLHLLGGVDKPTYGNVYIDGQNVYEQSEDALSIFRRRQVGLVYQFYNLLPMMSVVENITMPMLLDGRNVNREYLDELLCILGLEKERDYLPNQLSGGQQQRVSIGRALINSPTIVLADEPTGNLDSVNSQQIAELLKFSNKHFGQTMILITHDQSLALQTDRILTLADGEIVSDKKLR